MKKNTRTGLKKIPYSPNPLQWRDGSFTINGFFSWKALYGVAPRSF